MNEGKREKRDATKRKDKDMEGKILPSRAHEHVVRENEDESPGRTGASHPGGQNSVLPDGKIGVPKSGKDVVPAIGAMHRVPVPWH